MLYEVLLTAASHSIPCAKKERKVIVKRWSPWLASKVRTILWLLLESEVLTQELRCSWLWHEGEALVAALASGCRVLAFLSMLL